VSYPIDPKLPDGFDNTPLDARPLGHLRWWWQPFIQTFTIEEQDSAHRLIGGKSLQMWNDKWRAAWLAAWPSGTRYDVRCLDGGASDRSTCWGCFPTLEDAIACCASGGPGLGHRGPTRQERARMVLAKLLSLREQPPPDAPLQFRIELTIMCVELEAAIEEENNRPSQLLDRLLDKFGATVEELTALINRGRS
jgi:hypothetical protein